MLARRNSLVIAGRGALVLMLVGMTGCGYAKRKDMDAQMAQLRQEMQSGDQASQAQTAQVDQKVTAMDGRVSSLEQKTAALEQELQTLRSDFNAQIEQLKGQLSFDVPVNFEFNSADLRQQDQPVLTKFASVVKDFYPNAVVTVEGFADPAGSTAYNMRLGQKRASAVKDYLVQQGLSGDALKVVSYGESRDRQIVPGAKGPGADGMQNRRVSLVIDYSGDPLAVRPVTN